MKKSKIPPRVKILGFVSLLNDSASEMIYPFLPVFITKYLGAGPAFLGLIEGAAESINSFLKLGSGWFSDRVKRKKPFVSIGYVIASFLRPLIGIARSWITVFFLRFFDRVGKGIRASPRDAMIAESSSIEIRGKSFGFHRGMDNLGAFIGPLIAFSLVKFANIDLRTLFILTLIPGIFVFILVVFFLKEIGSFSSEKVEHRENSKFSFTFKYYLFTLMIFTLGNSSDTFLFLKATETGVSMAFLPVLWMAHNLVKSSLSYPSGSLSDKIGRKKIIIFGWILYSIIYFGFAFSTSPFHVLFLFVVYGSVFGITEGVEKAFVADMVKPTQRGTAYGLYNFILGVSLFPASLITGVLWQKINSKAAFLFGAMMALVASILMMMLKESKQKEI
ncbi:MAG: MFS transporter [Acidobacteriota bacterium]